MSPQPSSPRRPGSQRPSTQRAGAQPVVVKSADDSSNFEFEPTDIVAGIVLMLAIPTIIYFAMGAIGKPVAGANNLTWEEALERQEKEAARNAANAIPITKPEYELRYAEAVRKLEGPAADYLSRAKALPESDVDGRFRWIEVSRIAAGNAKATFETLLNEVVENRNFSTQEQQQLRSKIAAATKVIDECKQLDPYSAARGR